ncbi:MAG: glutathione peroxidase [Bacteroidales bacterium]|nr:glutathione peroxidase [Bacteroidales bacterium]
MFSACNKPDPIVPEPPIPDTDTTVVEEPKDDIYQFSVLDGNGDSVSLAQYRGKVLLVVNTATQCGYTPQYTQLEQWYETYQDRGFVILDFPCNQFGGQAPGDYDDIHDFCTGTYNISFPQFAKIDVNGVNESPLYTWLKSKKPGRIEWNFTKFLINRNGEVVDRFASNYSMTKVEQAIVAELDK